MNELVDTRLTEFRQFKKEIRGSKDHLIVGIDVAKDKHHAFLGTATGKTFIRRLIFDNTIEGFENLLTQVRAVQVAQGLPKAVFGLEPTANYHKPLGEHLIKCEFAQFVQRVVPGRKTLAQQQRLQTIQQMAIDSIGCEMGEGAHFEAEVMVDGLRQVRETIKTTDERIRETCRQFPEYGYLLTIPGFGPDISAQVIGAIGNPFRFQNRKQVLKMAGLDLSADRSGKPSDTAIPVIPIKSL
jgi:transposase